MDGLLQFSDGSNRDVRCVITHLIDYSSGSPNKFQDKY